MIERHVLNALRGRVVGLRRRAKEEKDRALCKEPSGIESVLEAVLEGDLTDLHDDLAGEEHRLETGMCTG